MYTPAETLEYLYAAAIHKKGLPYYKRALSGILGGICLGFGGIVAFTLGSYWSQAGNAPAAIVFLSFTFPIALWLILFTKVDLFTSNCMLVAIAMWRDAKHLEMWSDKKHRYNVFDVFFLLINSWIWNFVGNLCFVYFLLYKGDLLNSRLGPYVLGIAKKKMCLPHAACFTRAIAANWLVNLAVYMSYHTDDVLGKAFVMWFPIMTFVACGFEHCIANMFTLPMAIVYNVHVAPVRNPHVTWLGFSRNIWTATFGNIVGGAFVGVVYSILYDSDRFFDTIYYWQGLISGKPVEQPAVKDVEAGEKSVELTVADSKENEDKTVRELDSKKYSSVSAAVNDKSMNTAAFGNFVQSIDEF